MHSQTSYERLEDDSSFIENVLDRVNWCFCHCSRNENRENVFQYSAYNLRIESISVGSDPYLRFYCSFNVKRIDPFPWFLQSKWLCLKGWVQSVFSSACWQCFIRWRSWWRTRDWRRFLDLGNRLFYINRQSEIIHILF